METATHPRFALKKAPEFKAFLKLSELSFLHRLEPPLSVLNPHFCGGFCLLPLIRIVPAPESHHGVSLL